MISARGASLQCFGAASCRSRRCLITQWTMNLRHAAALAFSLILSVAMADGSGAASAETASPEAARAPKPTVKPTSLNFGKVHVDSEATNQVTLVNGSSAAITISGITTTNSEFTASQIAAFARPALAQSDDDASSDNSKKAVSELSVSPTTLDFSTINLDKKKLSETKHFEIKNTGKATLDNLVVGAPTNSDYVITTVIPTTLPGEGHLTVNVLFTPKGKGTENGKIVITSGATKGKKNATVHLKGKATQRRYFLAASTSAALRSATLTLRFRAARKNKSVSEPAPFARSRRQYASLFPVRTFGRWGVGGVS